MLYKTEGGQEKNLTCLERGTSQPLQFCDAAKKNISDETYCTACVNTHMKTPLGSNCVKKAASGGEQSVAQDCKTLTEDGLDCDECVANLSGS